MHVRVMYLWDLARLSFGGRKGKGNDEQATILAIAGTLMLAQPPCELGCMCLARSCVEEQLFSPRRGSRLATGAVQSSDIGAREKETRRGHIRQVCIDRGESVRQTDSNGMAGWLCCFLQPAGR
jgi:hypothetical protein